MKKKRLDEIKEHFSYCIDTGLSIGEQEEKLLFELYETIEKSSIDELIKLQNKYVKAKKVAMNMFTEKQKAFYEKALKD